MEANLYGANLQNHLLTAVFDSIEPPDHLRVPNASLGARRLARTSETALSEDRLNLYERHYEKPPDMEEILALFNVYSVEFAPPPPQ
jgi:hypothetical protein